uniref:Uncharacterized protein n=1 Tax=Arundo donax TaxID=35708 RepID=A0A0A9HAR5_ARUDO
MEKLFSGEHPTLKHIINKPLPSKYSPC